MFNVDNGQIGVVDASGMSGAQAISYDLLDPEIYCNKTLHITLEDISGKITWCVLVFVNLMST